MSRRRKMKPAAKRLKDAEKARLRFVCTGGGRHGRKVEFLREYGQYVRPGAASPDVMQTVDEGALLGTQLPACPRCGDAATSVPDDAMAAIGAVLESTRPGQVLRYDVSTGRLLT